MKNLKSFTHYSYFEILGKIPFMSNNMSGQSSTSMTHKNSNFIWFMIQPNMWFYLEAQSTYTKIDFFISLTWVLTFSHLSFVPLLCTALSQNPNPFFLTGENISHHLCSTFSVSDTIGAIYIFKSNRPVWEGFYFPNLTNSTQLLCVKVGTRTQVSLTPCTKSNHISPKHPKALGCVYTCKGQTGMKIIR